MSIPESHRAFILREIERIRRQSKPTSGKCNACGGERRDVYPLARICESCLSNAENIHRGDQA